MTKIGISQNGYDVFDNTNNFVRTTVEGVGFWSLDEDIATILDDFTQKFHDQIEHIDLPVRETPGYDDWSYAVRPVRGQTTGYSNHGSATARDLNATRHPRGVRNTYSAAKRAALRDLVNSYDGVLRHGEFYSDVIDGMHVEIDGSRVQVTAMAKKIRERKVFVMASKDDVKEALREVLREKTVLKEIAEQLFKADVIEAPDVEPDSSKNPTWSLRSILNRIINNTTAKAPGA
jgi:hypothetical protein